MDAIIREERERSYVEEFGISLWLSISKESKEILINFEPRKMFNRPKE